MAPGSVRELAICDPADGTGGTYAPIAMRDLPASIDFDQIEALGGAEFDAIQGTPIYGQQRRDFIYLYPPNDETPRKLRIRGHIRKTFATEGQVSTCDGQAIVYWGVALAYGAAGDVGQQAFYSLGNPVVNYPWTTSPAPGGMSGLSGGQYYVVSGDALNYVVARFVSGLFLGYGPLLGKDGLFGQIRMRTFFDFQETTPSGAALWTNASRRRSRRRCIVPCRQDHMCHCRGQPHQCDQ
jgi:hypothetical protein